MNLRTGFEQLRVAHALVDLPEVTAAFNAGRISYSKVRAVTRIATPATESKYLYLALAGTASHLERIVRHARQATADPVAAAARRELHWRWDDDGTLILRGRLTAEQGAQLIAALESATAHKPARADASTAPELSASPRPSASPQPSASPRPSVTAHSSASPEHCPAEQSDTRPDPIAARRADALIALTCGETTTATEVVVVINADTDEHPEECTAHIHNGPALPACTAERIGCNARVRALLKNQAGNRLYLGRARRLASPAQMLALKIRDHGTCRFPGCDATHHLDAHHIVHWLFGGRTDIDNLVLLCARHHKLIHDHGYYIRKEGDVLTFHQPDRRPVPTTAPSTSGDAGAITTDPGIDRDTLTPYWTGERLDLDAALFTLLREPELVAA
jgi:hypothetical protein